MAERRKSGKLAVILHADVAGSTGLVQQDEHIAHERIQQTFQRLSNTITKYHGRVRELRGDALLAEFERASGAVSAALALQADQEKYSQSLNDSIRPLVRVGIAMGEVVIADNTITGEGVVLAQRLEQLATPGGVVIQAVAHETIPSRFPFEYADLGEHDVKGFEKPVHAYSARLKKDTDIPSPEQADHRVRNTIIAFASITVVAVATALIWFKPWEVREEPASVERMAFPLPDKPSIAVLPFDNLSGDPAQDYFVDGLTEDIITELSRFPELFVISRTSTFTYKDKPVKVGEVAEELGVRYVLEGSVRRTDTELLVTAQLIDATSGVHIWAERYERPVTEFHFVQADVLNRIVSTVADRVENVGLRIAKRKQTENLSAYEHVLQGYALVQHYAKESNEQARVHFEKAIALDAQYARAYSGLAFTHNLDYNFGWSEDVDASLNRAREASLQAIALDDSDNRARTTLGWTYVYQGRVDEGVTEIERAVRLNPNDAGVLARGGYALTYQGEFENAIDQVEKAMRLNPFHPDYYYDALGWAQYFLEQYNDALRTMTRIAKPNAGHNRSLAVIYARLGQMDKAQDHASKVVEQEPDFAISVIAKTQPFKDPGHLEFYLEGLRLAGLPEHPPLKLPDKPSIAVLPFTNMSGDSAQEYFADGITEDLTTDLAKIAGLFVIARNSAFTYKGKAVKVPEVARELGVRYVLEGSVQRAGETVRVNAQLIDSTTGGHVWAERYDGSVDDIFSLQDRITGQIVAALAVELTADERQRAIARETENLEAYDWFLQGWNQFRHGTPDTFVKAVEFFTQAIGLDPDYGRAHAALAETYFLAGERGFSRKLGITWAESRHRARHHLRLALKHPTSLAHQVASTMALKQRLYTEALRHAEEAVALDPSDAGAHSQMAYALLYAGTPDEAIEFARRAMRLDPSNPGLPLQWQGRAEFSKGNLEEAVALLERGRQHRPTLSAVQVLAAAYAQLGHDDEARAALKIYQDRTGWSPTLKQLMYFWPYKDAVVAERFADGLIKAGLSGPPGGYFVVSERDRVTGSEMLGLIGGRTTGGSDLWSGEPWSREYFADGRVIRRDGAEKSEGKFQIKGDLLCEQWGPSYQDCYPIFRNENGSPETKDEYLSMLDTGSLPWSFEE